MYTALMYVAMYCISWKVYDLYMLKCMAIHITLSITKYTASNVMKDSYLPLEKGKIHK